MYFSKIICVIYQKIQLKKLNKKTSCPGITLLHYQQSFADKIGVQTVIKVSILEKYLFLMFCTTILLDTLTVLGTNSLVSIRKMYAFQYIINQIIKQQPLNN